MNTQTIDQSASEVQLHRVLYILKFQRGQVIHFLLTALAALLLIFAGIDGVYPVASNFVHALQALSIQVQDGPVGLAGYWIVFSLLFVGVLSLLIWIYRSITNVRRIALRFQAVLVLIMCLSSVNTKWPELKFAFENLSTEFAVLAAVSAGSFLLVLPVSVAIALWGVSRCPERSSLLATLDSRLAPNLWVYLNKLLDLPRTPLRTIPTAAAYVLSLVGTILLIASVMHLFSLGGLANTLGLLAMACTDEVMPECIAQSSVWARQTLLSMLVALVGLKIAGFLQSTAKRLGVLGVSDVIKKPNDRFVLYLRPFDADNVILPKPRLPLLSRLFSFTPYPVRIEQELFDVADGYRPLIAGGKPGEKNMRGDVAYRAYLADSEWQEYVTAKIRAADRIVMVLKNTDGVRWEFDRLIGEGAIMKTLYLFDPAVRKPEEWETIEKMVRPMLQNAGVALEGVALKPQLIGFFFQKGNLVEIINTNRTATSYRTAFSHFLAEDLG
ncbi:MAG TPA: hypothetical protein VGW39_09365 [Chthoniobacterales bacterium]|nr:hypothetical protein [Chthoniobacterales bacterium]